MWEEVKKYCCADDFKNLSCCCKHLHQLLKPIVWRRVQFYAFSNDELVAETLTNLQFTRDLYLRHVRHVPTGLESFKIARVIGACDPVKARVNILAKNPYFFPSLQHLGNLISSLFLRRFWGSRLRVEVKST